MHELIELIKEAESIPQCYWSIRKSQTHSCYRAGVRIGNPMTHAYRYYDDDPVAALRKALNDAKEATQ